MLARYKFHVVGTVMYRMLKANFSCSRVCRSVHNHSCINHKFTVFSNNSNWTINDSLKIDKQKEVNTIWLRENCRCNECYNLEKQERRVLFYKQKPNSFEIESLKEAGEGETIEVLWGDRHVSYYDKEWLRNSLTNDNLHFQDKKQFLWNANTILPYMQGKQIDYNDLLNDKATLKSACENLYEYGVLQVKNVPKNMDDTGNAAEKISAIKETFFGRKWEVSVLNSESDTNIDFKDTSYTNIEIEPHTDGNYFSEPPSIAVFHYIKTSDVGGELVLVDGFKAAEELRQLDARAYKILTEHLVNFSYKDEARFFNQSCATLELDNTTGNLKRIRYNHHDRSAHFMHSTSIPSSDFYEALACFSKIIDDPQNHLEVNQKPGTAYFIDNWRVFHSRKAFKGERIFVGCWLERDNFMSNLRLL